MIKTTAALTLALALLTASGGRAEEFDPYLVPKDTVASRVHVIALHPAVLPRQTGDEVQAAAVIEAAVAGQLEAKGYGVVPSSEWQAVWREMATPLGNVFDPISGAADPKKRDAAYDFTMRELERRHGVEASLFIVVDLRRVNVRFVNGFTQTGFFAFDQQLNWNGEPLGLALEWFPQRVIESYLNLNLVDAASVRLYSISYPIEWTSLYALRSRYDVPRGQLYGRRVPKAVTEVLEPLVKARKPAQ